MHYYTYAYLREDKTPYYIGKGTGKRIYSKQRSIKPPKDKSRIIFLKKNLTEEEAFKHEIYMIDVFGRKDLGTGILYNMTDGGEGSSGCIPSEESRRKMGDARKGENHYLYGKSLSEETKTKMSEAHKGRTPSEESRRKMSDARKGKTHTEETRRKISEANKDKNHPNYGKTLSEETKRKMGDARKGRTHSEETKRKLSEAKKGKNPSEETKTKMSEAQKGKKCWNDGCGNCKRMVECPGDGWKPGMK